MRTNPEISVIIPAMNEEGYINFPLRGLRKQSFRNFEIIVVDGGSEDNTVKISKGYGAKVLVERKRGISPARNMGANAARGEVLVFLDADTKPSRNLLAAYSRVFADKDVIAATGPILPLEKTNLRIRNGYKFVSVFFVKSSIRIGRPSIVGSNFAVRKSVFMKHGGFDEKLITYEDWDLSGRLRKSGRIVYADEAVVYTSVRRIKAWGVSGFFIFHVSNIFRYHLLRKPKDNYKEIR